MKCESELHFLLFTDIRAWTAGHNACTEPPMCFQAEREVNIRRFEDSYEQTTTNEPFVGRKCESSAALHLQSNIMIRAPGCIYMLSLSEEDYDAKSSEKLGSGSSSMNASACCSLKVRNKPLTFSLEFRIWRHANGNLFSPLNSSNTGNIESLLNIRFPRSRRLRRWMTPTNTGPSAIPCNMLCLVAFVTCWSIELTPPHFFYSHH